MKIQAKRLDLLGRMAIGPDPKVAVNSIYRLSPLSSAHIPTASAIICLPYLHQPDLAFLYCLGLHGMRTVRLPRDNSGFQQAPLSPGCEAVPSGPVAASE